MDKKDWKPDAYLQFNRERTRPSKDLVSRISLKRVEKILDMGCGPGNSTCELKKRWPSAAISGLDNSPAMIEKARKTDTGIKWILGNASTYTSNEGYQLVFSNALLQWLPQQGRVLSTWSSLLTGEGSLAVQLPLFWDMPLGKIIRDKADSQKWKTVLSGLSDLIMIKEPGDYHDYLSPLFSRIELWVTDYYHVFRSQQQIMDMIRTTGLKPYLEKLDTSAEKKDFESEIFEDVRKAYPLQRDGSVLFPFKRLFFIAEEKKL